MALSTELRTTASKLRTRQPGMAETHANASRLFRELQVLGFAKTMDDFATPFSPDGRPALDGPAIASYFEECAEMIDRR